MNSEIAALHGHHLESNLQLHSNTPAPATTDGIIQKMSSLEIAELTGKRHSDVKRDIENTLQQAGIDVSRFARIYKDSQNRDQYCYDLPRRECDLVISGYSVPYRLAIIDRWLQLEAQYTPPAQLSRLDVLRIALLSEEENQRLSAEVDEMRPKAQALALISTSDGSLCITNSAKNLQMKPKHLFDWLSENRWIYRRAGGGGWVAYQDRLRAGYLEHKVTIVSRTDGSEKTTEQVRVTPKGLVKLSMSLIGESSALSGDAHAQ